MNLRSFPLLFIPILTAAVTFALLLDPAAPVLPTSAVGSARSDVDVEAELRTGCEHLIALATTDTQHASWAIAQLQRAATAPWASPALRAQAEQGLSLLGGLIAGR